MSGRSIRRDKALVLAAPESRRTHPPRSTPRVNHIFALKTQHRDLNRRVRVPDVLSRATC